MATKILIVEDEKLLSYTMEEMLDEFGYNNNVIANSYSEALAIIQKGEIELAILDINLGEGPGGIELAKECFMRDIPFFYVTSHTDRKILDLALETAPGGYVVKPVVPSSLYSTINIILNKLEEKPLFFHFKDGSNNIRLNTNEILFLEAEGIYAKVVTTSKNYLIRKSLSTLLSELPKHQFAQVHRSFLVRLNAITKSKSDLIFIDDYEIPISRTYKNEFRQRFQKGL